ncbi:MAG: tetratricopeptide repeat protein [Candidatus Aminicenantes bacterium]|nr:tetratricopeptide repeat protein [Candidatus Aminicenantes bacterium]
MQRALILIPASSIAVFLSLVTAAAFAAAAAPLQEPPQLSELEGPQSRQALARLQQFFRTVPDAGAPAVLHQVLEGTTAAAAHTIVLGEYQRRKLHGQGRATLEALSKEHPARAIYAIDLVQLAVLEGDLDRAKADLRSAAARFPHDTELHANLGRWLYGRQQTDLALAELLRAQQTGLRDPQTNLVLASLLARAGALEDAIDTAVSITVTPGLDPRIRAEAAALAGKSYAILRDESKAVEFLEQAIQYSPQVEDYYLSLASAHQQAENAAAAVQALRRGWARLPGAPGIGQTLSRQLLAAGQAEEAVRVLALLTSRHPNHGDALRLLAQAYRSAGDAAKASQTWRTLIRQQPRYPMANIFLAQSLAEEGAPPEQVLAALDKAEQISPQDADLYYLRGRIFNSLGRHQDAVAQLQRAIRLQPGFSGAYYQLGLAYQQLGQPELAQEQFRRRSHLEEGTGRSR